MRGAIIAAIAWMACVASAMPTSTPDCSLGGVYDATSQRCVCFPEFGGRNCSLLSLGPAQGSPFAYAPPQTSSWGGSVLANPAGGFDMYLAGMEQHCGLNAWECNSAIVRAHAAQAEGPYETVATLLPAFAHNPTAHHDWASNSTVVFHIGGGFEIDGRSPLHCSNGSTPAALVCGGSSRAQRLLHESEVAAGTPLGRPNMLVAPTAAGPWTVVPGQDGSGRPSSWQFNNPAPLIFRNGSVLMMFKVSCGAPGTAAAAGRTSAPFCRRFALATAPSFRGPYTSAGLTDLYGEDAFIWQDTHKGFFHVVFQGGSYGPCGAACNYTGHFHLGWSASGLDGWTLDRTTEAFPASVLLANGTSVDFARRERHQVLFDASGRPTHLFNGALLSRDSDEVHTIVQPITTA